MGIIARKLEAPLEALGRRNDESTEGSCVRSFPSGGRPVAGSCGAVGKQGAKIEILELKDATQVCDGAGYLH